MHVLLVSPFQSPINQQSINQSTQTKTQTHTGDASLVGDAAFAAVAAAFAAVDAGFPVPAFKGAGLVVVASGLRVAICVVCMCVVGRER